MFPLFFNLLGRHTSRRIVFVVLFCRYPAASSTPIAGEFHFTENHSLIDELVEGLGLRHVSTIVEHLVPEAAIEEMENSVLGATDIKVHRHPGLLHFGIDNLPGISWIQKAEKIPARARPLRHGVGLALVSLSIPFHK